MLFPPEDPCKHIQHLVDPEPFRFVLGGNLVGGANHDRFALLKCLHDHVPQEARDQLEAKAKEKDPNILPLLHYAIKKQSSIRQILPVLEYLIQMRPQELHLEDNDGNTPFFWAIQQTAEASSPSAASNARVIFYNLLHKCGKAATRTPNKDGFLALHEALVCNAPQDVLLALLEHNPTAIYSTIDPVHLAASNEFCRGPEALFLILQMDPSLLSHFEE